MSARADDPLSRGSDLLMAHADNLLIGSLRGADL